MIRWFMWHPEHGYVTPSHGFSKDVREGGTVLGADAFAVAVGSPGLFVLRAEPDGNRTVPACNCIDDQPGLH